MEKRNSILIIILVFLFLYACKNGNVETIYYDNTKRIKEQRLFSFDNDTTHYEYVAFYQNGRIKSKGMIIDSQKEGLWEDWYEDGMLRRKVSYVDGEPDIRNTSRILPEIIFENDSLFLDEEAKFKVLNLYPNESLVGNVIISDLYNDPCFDMVIKPTSTDSIFIGYFSSYEYSRIDTTHLKDIKDAKRLKITDERFEELKRENPNFILIEKTSKSIILKRAAVYERGNASD